MSYDFKTDIHTHTFFSRHAYSTVEENVRAAAEQGLELLGTTDHFGAMISHINDTIAFQHIYNLAMLPKVWHGVRLLHGAEADIVDLEGNLFGHDIIMDVSIVGDPVKPEPLTEKILYNADYVIASIHSKGFCQDATPLQVTKMYIGALSHPRVKILGHIGRTGLDMDYKEVLLAAKSMGKYIEFNEHSFNFPWGDGTAKCRQIATLAAELGVEAVVGTDAHVAYNIGKYEGTKNMLKEVGFPEELIVNRTKDTFLAALGIE